MNILKTQNTGNTFTGLIMAAFGLKDQRDVKQPLEMFHYNMGTIEVRGKAYDWFDRGDSVDFFEAE